MIGRSSYPVRRGGAPTVRNDPTFWSRRPGSSGPAPELSVASPSVFNIFAKTFAVTVAECCGGSYHGCLMPACEDCKWISDLRNRRPGHCCKRGHHHRYQVLQRREQQHRKKREDSPAPDTPGLNRRNRGNERH
ncbi:hypothetical protein DIPPA_13914 [Diplonema papillatum]|nr:hypothetical protein DIPPA_13914 [Diplonema papillatum]